MNDDVDQVFISGFRPGALGLGLFAGVLLVAGCGEKEARIIPANKSKNELQKDIENPYGVHLKVPIKGQYR